MPNTPIEIHNLSVPELRAILHDLYHDLVQTDAKSIERLVILDAISRVETQIAVRLSAAPSPKP